MNNLISLDNVCGTKCIDKENILFSNNKIQRVKSLLFIDMMNITKLSFPQIGFNTSRKAIQTDNYEYCVNTMAEMIKKYISKI